MANIANAKVLPQESSPHIGEKEVLGLEGLPRWEVQSTGSLEAFLFPLLRATRESGFYSECLTGLDESYVGKAGQCLEMWDARDV